MPLAAGLADEGSGRNGWHRISPNAQAHDSLADEGRSASSVS
jgi:hypothetical protein